MNCHDFQDWLQRRLDGEPLQDSEGLDAHLGGCMTCRRQHHAGQLLLDGLRNVKRPAPNEGFKQRILRGILMDRQARRLRLRRRLVTTTALAACLLLAALAGQLWLPDTRKAPADFSLAEKNVPGPEKQASVPAMESSLTKSAQDATAAVATLSERLADRGKEQAKLLWSVAANEMGPFVLPEAGDLERPLDPAAKALQQTGQGMADGLQTVAQSARRAVSYFFRELPPLEPAAKAGS